MEKGRKGPSREVAERPQRRGFRGTAENAKTRICLRWQNGECRFGDRCNFAHGDDELRQLPPRVEGGGPGRGRGRGRGYDPSYNEDGENPPVGRGPGRGQGRQGSGNGAAPVAAGGSRDHSAWIASGRPVRGPNGWTQYQTESGEKYYHNVDTNVTQWEPPVDWKGPT